MGGFIDKTPPVRCMLWGFRGSREGLEMVLWGLAPPADEAAGGVNPLCIGFSDVGGFISKPPLIRCMIWGIMGKGWRLRVVSPTSSDAGGVSPSAGGPIRGLSLKDLGLFKGLREVWNLQQLGNATPPAPLTAGGTQLLMQFAHD